MQASESCPKFDNFKTFTDNEWATIGCRWAYAVTVHRKIITQNYYTRMATILVAILILVQYYMFCRKTLTFFSILFRTSSSL